MKQTTIVEVEYMDARNGMIDEWGGEYPLHTMLASLGASAGDVVTVHREDGQRKQAKVTYVYPEHRKPTGAHDREHRVTQVAGAR